MRDMGNVAGDVERLRNERNARKNPPKNEIGQGDDTDWSFFDNDESSLSTNDSDFMGSNYSDNLSFDTHTVNGVNNNGISQEHMAKNLTSTEDKIIDALLGFCKLIFGWVKILYGGIKVVFQNANPFFWSVFGKRLLLVGLTTSTIGIVLMLLDLFTYYFSGGFWVMIGGMLSMVVGLLTFAFNYEEGKNYIGYKHSNSENDNCTESNNDIYDGFEDDEDDEDIEDGWGSFGESEEEDDEDDLSVWNNLENWGENTTDTNGVYEEDIDIDSVIEGIREIPAHTQTRQYLFEEYSKVLPIKNPEFSRLKVISENSDNFIIFDKILYDAALQVGTKEDKLPELLELRENSFIIQLKSTRPSGLKEEAIADEIANIYSKDDFGKVLHEGVYATTSSVGSNFIINLFKGENSLITLADTYREVKDYVLDPSVNKPIIMGVNELGKVWHFDADNVFSFIISGKPRSGKSWAAVSLVLQLCMYSSPKEVIFEVFDVKGTSSDYYSMKDMLPHFKRFESDGKRIINRLKYLTTVEADRRKKILNANNSIAIADLKKKSPDVEIPYLYVVIDEIVGLMGTFSKKESADFKDLMNTLITQMPNLGIKLILIPHRVTNDIVPKTTYVNVGCTACVRSDFSEIQNVLGVTKKEFPYDLINKGDMALKTGELNKGKSVFCHGIAVTSSNDSNKDIYKFVGSLWNMLEPSEEDKVSETRNVDYKGHDLTGVNSVIGSDEFLLSDEDIEEDFWKSMLD